MSPVAGWYPDPSSPSSGLRYWDGGAWTEHVAPAWAVQAPTHAGPRAGSHTGSGGGRSSVGVVVGIVLGALGVIAAAAFVAVRLVGGDPGSDDPAGGAASGRVLEVGRQVEASVPEDGAWSGRLRVDGPTAVVLDARAAGGADLVLEVRSPDGTAHQNDDRWLTQEGAGDTLDPALAVVLEPGEHEVVLTEYSGRAAGFTLDVRGVEPLPTAGPVPVEVPGGDAWHRVLDVPEAGTYVLDTRSRRGDAVLTVARPDGPELSSNDTDEGAGSFRDPYLRERLEAGPHVVTVTGWSGEPVSLELTVAVE